MEEEKKEELPKYLEKYGLHPRKWTDRHFQNYLDDVGLSDLKDVFEKESIDGSVFFDLEESDFKNILDKEKIQQILKIKEELLQYVDKDIKKRYFTSVDFLQINSLHKEFAKLNQFIEHKSPEVKKVSKSELKKQSEKEENANSARQSLIISGKSKIVDNSNNRIIRLEQFLPKLKKTEIFEFSEKSIRIGKGVKSEILFDKNDNNKLISTNHAKIILNEYGYYLIDEGSSNGVFVLIADTMEVIVKPGLIFAIDDYIFNVDKIFENNVFISMEEGDKITVPIKRKEEKSTIGSKNFCDVVLDDKTKIKPEHIKFWKKGQFVFFSPCNKFAEVWLKLEQKASYPLHLDIRFRLSNSPDHEFQVKKSFFKKEDRSDGKYCCICGKNEKNTIVFPCNHKFACEECMKTKKISSCRICNEYIQEFTKIFL